MLDTNVWSAYRGEKAEYAIGAPTLELFCKSYNNTHAEKIDYTVTSSGYDLKWKSDNGYNDNISGLNTSESLYVLNNDKASGYWLSCPSTFSEGFLLEVDSNSSIMFEHINGESVGIRPIVCLKKEVELENQENGIYNIK